MKNIIIVVLLSATLVTGYIAAKAKLKMSFKGLEGKTETVIRGDLTLPINATGEVRPALRVEIKSKASGEVIEISRQPGDRVQVGDLLIRLQRDDEERNVNKAKLDVAVAEARLEDARIRLKLARTSDLISAESRVTQLRESTRLTKYRMEKVQGLAREQTNEEELLQREVAYNREAAQLVEAQALVEKAKLSANLAEQTVKQAEATFQRAGDTLADARKILSETDIVAPIAGIIGDVKVQIGEVIQGGKTTFTGGTLLATVLDMDRLIVGAEVDESDVERVRAIAPDWAIPGHDESARMPEDPQEAAAGMEDLPIITVESFRDREFRGVIERIYPEPRTISGVVTYMVDVVITSDNRNLLLPGMRADVRFTSEHLENVVLCTNEAIREGLSGKLGVYIPKPGVEASERETQFVACKFGLSNGSYSHVLCEELTEGTIVYTKLPIKRDKDED